MRKLLLISAVAVSILSATTPNRESVTELYIATFDRAPDSAGINYWLNDSGLSLEGIAQSFFDQPETRQMYPADSTIDELIKSVYNNLFGREPDIKGADYWKKELQSGNIRKDQFILAAMNGALGSDAKLLKNKLDVAEYFTQKGLNDIHWAKQLMETVKADSSGVDEAKKRIDSIAQEREKYHLHNNITATMFYVGEGASGANGYISNSPSAWDNHWVYNYGGIDDPSNRKDYFPADFTPAENPFYVALPYNDLGSNGKRKPGISKLIPWADEAMKEDDNSYNTICKNRWVRVSKGQKSAYVQWEDVGPFNSDDSDYVFGSAKPKSSINSHAGIDLSPAVTEYLGLNGLESVSWSFVDDENVPDGPWKKIVTTSKMRYQLKLGDSYYIQLQGNIDTSQERRLYDIDLFDTDKDMITKLHNDGRLVICYFSAGSWEDWREDASDFPKDAIGKALDGWEGENWLDIRSKGVREIMKERLDLAREKGCDAVDPDNMDGYTNDTGFDLSASDQLDYNKFIAIEARKRGLSVGLKNDLLQIKELEPYYDFAVNEQCHIYSECDYLDPFVKANKPVYNIEYASKYVKNENGARDELCKDSKNRGLTTLVMPMALDGSFVYYCE